VNDYLLRYQEWLEKSAGWVREDLESLKFLPSRDFEEQLRERFGLLADFGTGGIRQIVRAGTNGLNDPWVIRVSLGLSRMVKSAIIAYDTRHRSRYFALLAARTLAAQGVRVLVFDEPAPTPVLSFAIRRLKTQSGLVITASHNEPAYNGIKVYDNRGVQMVPSRIETLKTHLESFGFFERVPEAYAYDFLGEEIKTEYLKEVSRENAPFDLPDGRRHLILYTPLHGTGGAYIPPLLDRFGFDCRVVEKQSRADPTFSTVRYPNPEDPEAFGLALTQAKGMHPMPEMILATDPDADRIGVYLLENDSYRPLSGNEIGLLLTDFLVRATPTHPERTEDRTRVLLKTIVTSDSVKPYALKNRIEVIETLTGFKFLGDRIEAINGENKEFLAAYEESYGFLHGDHARDKDALSTALLLGLLLRNLGSASRMIDRLQEIYREFGFYRDSAETQRFEGSEGARRIEEFMSALRAADPHRLFSLPVEAVRDYNVEVDPLWRADVFLVRFNQGMKAIFRPSGTETKLKIYLSAVGKTQEECEGRYHTLKTEITRAASGMLASLTTADPSLKDRQNRE